MDPAKELLLDETIKSQAKSIEALSERISELTMLVEALQKALKCVSDLQQTHHSCITSLGQLALRPAPDRAKRLMNL